MQMMLLSAITFFICELLCKKKPWNSHISVLFI
jgi:hypothetical protein